MPKKENIFKQDAVLFNDSTNKVNFVAAYENIFSNSEWDSKIRASPRRELKVL